MEEVVDQVVRRVLHHIDLLEHDASLLLDLFGVEGGVEEDVGEEVYGVGEELVEDLGVVADVLAAGEGVQDAAHRVDLPGDVQGAAAGGSFEEKVFYEVGDAVQLPPFVAGAVGDPDTYGD